MPLTADEQVRLADLYRQRDAINTGRQVSATEYAGQRTEFSRPDPQRLDRSIQELEAKARSRTGRARGAIGFRGL